MNGPKTWVYMPPSRSDVPEWEHKVGFWSGRWRSFRYAWAGIRWLFGHENNARFHLGAAVAVIVAGLLFGLECWEWCVVILCIGGMFAAEGLNTAIEKLADHVCPERNPHIKVVKDVAAGAVFLMTFACVAVGLIIFLPRLFALF